MILPSSQVYKIDWYYVLCMRLFLQVLFWFRWMHYIYLALLLTAILLLFLSGFSYSGQNWHEWAWWGFWWLPSTSCISFMCYLIVSSILYHIKFHPCMLLTFSIDTNEMIFCNHTGNGRLYSRSYSKFGTTPGYTWCLCTYVLPNSSPQIFLLLWPS